MRIFSLALLSSWSALSLAEAPILNKAVADCTLSAALLPLPGTAVAAGADVRLTAQISGGTAPYAVAWDVDGDAVVDDRSSVASGQTELLTRYNRAQSPTATISVTDAAGCNVVSQRQVDVVSSDPLVSTFTLSQLTGDQDSQVEPGETWRLHMSLTNNGAATVDNGYALFTPSGSTAGFRLINPAFKLPDNVPFGQAVQVTTDFYLDPTVQCGAALAVQFLGVADNRGVSGRPATISIPAPTGCTPSTNLPAPPRTSNLFRNGAYFNTRRSGNGLVSYLIPGSNGNDTLYAQWFTADRSRQPIWYYFLGRISDGQAIGTMVKRSRNVMSNTFSTFDETVGSAQITVVGPEELILTHQLLDAPQGGDRLQHLFSGLPAATPNRTGAWYTLLESGWGQTFDTIAVNGTSAEYILAYVYDSVGAPRWLTSDIVSANTPTFDMLSAPLVHCPSCAWVPLRLQHAGSASRTFTTVTTGVLSTNFNVPAGGAWIRTNVPISLLTAPQP